MDQHLLVLFSGELRDAERVSEIVGSESCHCENLTDQVTVQGTCCRRTCVACVDLTHTAEVPANIKWMSKPGRDLKEYLTQETEDNTKENEDDSTDTAALLIHSLADQIKQTVNFKIIWEFPAEQDFHIRDNLELFGALQRLVTWHRAILHIMAPESCEDRGLDEWAEMLQATLLPPGGQISTPLWFGTVYITGTKSSLKLPGFSMIRSNDAPSLTADETGHTAHCKVLLDRKLEILGTIKQTHLPVFYISDRKYKLRLTSESTLLQSSREFLKVLHDNPEICYIARLKFGTSVKRVAVQRDAWQDELINNSSNLADLADDLKWEGEVGYHHLMLLSTPDVGNTECFAFILCGAASLCAAFMHQVALRDWDSVTVYNPQWAKEVESWMGGAPVTSGKELLSAETTVQRAQLAMLSAWLDKRQEIGKDTNITAEELLSLLELTRMQVLQHLTPWQPQQLQQPQDHLYPLPNPLTDVRQSSSCEVELLALLCKEEQHGKGMPGSDILAGLSPPTKPHHVTLDAAEFLKLFNADGTAKITGLEPVINSLSPSKKLLRFDSGEKSACVEQWPACLSNNAHGKHYLNGEKAEKMEKICNKLKAKLQPIETLGFFTSPAASVAASRTKSKAKPGKKTPTPSKSKRGKQAAKPSDTPQRRSQRNQENVSNLKDSSMPESRSKPTPESRSRSSSRRSISIEQKPLSQSASRANSQSASGTSSQSTSRASTSNQSEKSEKESRSQRHKRKLEETVIRTLEKHGVSSTDPIFKSVSRKLFDLVKCYLKGLKTSHNLRQEMENLAEAHAEQVIAFERRYR